MAASDTYIGTNYFAGEGETEIFQIDLRQILMKPPVEVETSIWHSGGWEVYKAHMYHEHPPLESIALMTGKYTKSVLDLAASGSIKPKYKKRPFDEFEEAIEEVTKGKVQEHVLLDFNMGPMHQPNVHSRES
ncbi:hypothetical protein EMCG_08464 [[Emmonsia] crescens]|uniref:Uncharacterized protein n=1 Tax=[Emmonsia] crescens TaxID=73230 RepID=A0A0G2I645_9EURO|nr:hypothetical protein EMCG_08464 [Emmonsia crescens UAMH 3008]